MYFVYIIQCVDKSLYTGITTEVDRRFKEHCEGKGGHYTRSHPPKKIVYVETVSNRSQALKREAEIKRFRVKAKLALIKAKKVDK